MSGQFFSRSDIVKTAERRKERQELLEKRKQQLGAREHRESGGSPTPERNDLDAAAALTPPVVTATESPLAAAVTSATASSSSSSSSSTSSTPSSTSSQSTLKKAPSVKLKSTAAAATAPSSSDTAAAVAASKQKTTTPATALTTTSAPSSGSTQAKSASSSTKTAALKSISTATSPTPKPSAAASTSTSTAPASTSKPSESTTTAKSTTSALAGASSSTSKSSSTASKSTLSRGAAAAISYTRKPSSSLLSDTEVLAVAGAAAAAAALEPGAKGVADDSGTTYWAPCDSEHVTPAVNFSWSAIFTSMPGLSTSTSPSPPPPSSSSVDPPFPPDSSSSSSAAAAIDSALTDRISKFGNRASRASRAGVARSASTPTTNSGAANPTPTTTSGAQSSTPTTAPTTEPFAGVPTWTPGPEIPPASAEDEPVSASVLSRVSNTFGPAAKRKEVAKFGRTTSGTLNVGAAWTAAAAAASTGGAEAETVVADAELEAPIQASVLSRVSDKFGPPAKRKELINLGVVRTPEEGNSIVASKSGSKEGSVGPSGAPGSPGTPPDSELGATAAAPGAAAAADTSEVLGAVAAAAAAAEVENIVGKSSAPYLKFFRKKKLCKSARQASEDPSIDDTPPGATPEPEVFAPTPGPTMPQSTPVAQPPPSPVNNVNNNHTTMLPRPNREEAINRSQKNVCPNEECKTLNSYLSFKCIACKTKLGQLISCKGCGITVNETAGHCGKCGAGVATKSEIANAPVLDPKTQDAGAGVVKCPHHGCNTITHPSWKFCCQCGKSLKPHGPETMGPPAHLANLGLESEDSVDKLESENDDSPPPSAEDLTNASICGDTRKVVDLLLRGTDVNHLDEHGISSLNYACWNDRFNVVRVLTAFDADLNIRESRGYTALHASCDRSKSEALMEFLVKHGADLNGRGDMGESILHHAAAGGNLNGISFAIRQGIDVNDRDLEGATPLAYASLCDDIEPLEYLLSNGADINAKRTDGQTILHRAVQYRKTACLKFAIEQGLKVCDRDDEGHSALDIAYSTRAPQKIINFLREAFRTELSRCSFCEDAPAHIQFHPCHHQYACGDCCTRWKKCKCGKPIDKKVDVITDTKGESGKVEEDDALKFAEELAALQIEKERFTEEKTCAVCLDRPKAIVFDCGHTTCAECSLKMRLCHSCRKPIAKKIKFY